MRLMNVVSRSRSSDAFESVDVMFASLKSHGIVFGRTELPLDGWTCSKLITWAGRSAYERAMQGGMKFYERSLYSN